MNYPDKPIELEDGWQSYANPDCGSCKGEGMITGMGSQSKVISPCRVCWPLDCKNDCGRSEDLSKYDIQPRHLSRTANGTMLVTGQWICDPCLQQEEREDHDAVIRRALGQ